MGAGQSVNNQITSCPHIFSRRREKIVSIMDHICLIKMIICTPGVDVRFRMKTKYFYEIHDASIASRILFRGCHFCSYITYFSLLTRFHTSDSTSESFFPAVEAQLFAVFHTFSGSTLNDVVEFDLSLS
jgi:hypothetical protein